MSIIKLRYGAPVHFAGVKGATLAAICLDPATKRVTQLIVDEGPWRKTVRAIPFSYVLPDAGDEIHFDLLPDALQRFPEYQPGPSHPPRLPFQSHRPTRNDAGTDHGVSPSDLVLQSGIPVEGPRGPVGELNHLRVHPHSGVITHIGVRQGSLFITTRAIPMHLVSALCPDGITIHASREQLRGIPERVAARQP